MTDSERAVAAFLNNGGEIKVIEEGKTSKDFSFADDSLKNCTCGCGGNYTAHSMRLGEQGIYY